MKTLILLLVLATTAVQAQSLTISYDTVTVDIYYSGVIVIQENITDTITAVFDFENESVSITGIKGSIDITGACKTGDIEDGVQNFKGYIGFTEVTGFYSDTRSRVFYDNYVYTFYNTPIGNKL